MAHAVAHGIVRHELAHQRHLVATRREAGGDQAEDGVRPADRPMVDLVDGIGEALMIDEGDAQLAVASGRWFGRCHGALYCPNRAGNHAMTDRWMPGDLVRHPVEPDWGIGQVQSAIGDRVTVNFEHRGKVLINVAVVRLVPAEPDRRP